MPVICLAHILSRALSLPPWVGHYFWAKHLTIQTHAMVVATVFRIHVYHGLQSPDVILALKTMYQKQLCIFHRISFAISARQHTASRTYTYHASYDEIWFISMYILIIELSRMIGGHAISLFECSLDRLQVVLRPVVCSLPCMLQYELPVV